METENVNVKNWKSLIKPAKLDVKMSSDLTQAKIIAEPAGAMSSAALRKYKNKIKNKNIMCLICGGNNDPKRLPEIEKRSEEWLDKVKNETN